MPCASQRLGVCRVWAVAVVWRCTRIDKTLYCHFERSREIFLTAKRRFLRSARKLARERPKAIFILTFVAEHNTIRAVEMTPRFAQPLAAFSAPRLVHRRAKDQRQYSYSLLLPRTILRAAKDQRQYSYSLLLPRTILRAAQHQRQYSYSPFVAVHNTTRRERPKAIFILAVVAAHNTTRRERPKAIFILAVVAAHNTTRALEMTLNKQSTTQL